MNERGGGRGVVVGMKNDGFFLLLIDMLNLGSIFSNILSAYS